MGLIYSFHNRRTKWPCWEICKSLYLLEPPFRLVACELGSRGVTLHPIAMMCAQAVQTSCSLASGSRAPKAAPVKVVLPQRVGRLAAALLGNAGLVRLARADEGLQFPSLPDVQVPSVPDDLGGFLAENALLIGGGAIIVSIPFIINAIIGAVQGSDKAAKATTPANTFQALQDDERVLLVDIRSKADVKASGAPDLRPIKRKSISLPYTNVVKGEVELNEAFAENFAALKEVSEESLVILIDT
jgi:hypothetical protein